MKELTFIEWSKDGSNVTHYETYSIRCKQKTVIRKDNVDLTTKLTTFTVDIPEDKLVEFENFMNSIRRGEWVLREI